MPARKGQRRASLLRRIKRRFRRPGDGRGESKSTARLVATSPVSVASELVVMSPLPPPSRLAGSPAAPSDEENAVSPPNSGDSERDSLGHCGVRNAMRAAEESVPTETPLLIGENLGSDAILEKDVLTSKCSQPDEAPERMLSLENESPLHVQKKVASLSLDLELVRMVQMEKEKRSIQRNVFVGDIHKQIEKSRPMIMSPSSLASRVSHQLESHAITTEDSLPSKLSRSERSSREQILAALKDEGFVQDKRSLIEKAPSDLEVVAASKYYDHSMTTKEQHTSYPEQQLLEDRRKVVDVSLRENASDCPSDEKRDSTKNESTRMEPSAEGDCPPLNVDNNEKNEAQGKPSLIQLPAYNSRKSPTLVCEISGCATSLECPSDENYCADIPYLQSNRESELSDPTAKEEIHSELAIDNFTKSPVHEEVAKKSMNERRQTHSVPLGEKPLVCEDPKDAFNFVEEEDFVIECDVGSPCASQRHFIPITGSDTVETTRSFAIGTEEEGEYRAGRDVNIIGGTYKGKMGTVVKVLPKKIRVAIHDAQGTFERALNKENLLLITEKIDSDSEDSFLTAYERDNENDETVDGRILKKDLELPTKNVFKTQSNLETASSPDRRRSVIKIQEVVSPENILKEGWKVSIIGGTYRGRTGTIVKLLPKKVRVNIDDVNGAFERDLNKESLRVIREDTKSTHSTSHNIFEGSKDRTAKETTEQASGGREHGDASSGNDSLAIRNAFEGESMIEVASDRTDERGTCTLSHSSQYAGEVDALQEGRHVFIVGGTYSGKRGIVLKILPKKVRVLVEDEKKNIERALNRENLSFTGAHPGDKDVRQNSDGVLTYVQDAFDHKHSSKTNTIPDHMNAEIDEKKEKIPHVKNSARSRRAQHLSNSGEPAVFENGEGYMWRVPDSKKGGSRFGNRLVTKMRLRRGQGSEDNEDTFLTHWLQRRIFVTEIPINKCEMEDNFDKQVQHNGSVFELISVKIQADTDDPRSNLQYCSPQCIRLAYAQVSGPDIEKISLQEELDRLADFGQLSARKAVARLELFQSPACKFTNHPSKKFGIFFLQDSDFCEIEERGNVGCGFISEDFIVRLCGGNTEARRKTSIQVRIVIPRLGIFKGMLTKKRTSSMISPVELPSSMRKVGPSRHDPYRGAFLLITKNGLHPFPTNHLIGRLLDPCAKPPPKSFDATLKRKPISDMIIRLWKEVSVPPEESAKYARLSLKRDHLEHANVVGVADPTGQLPPGHIFVPGMGSQQFVHRKVFVTRFPCNQRWHGRVLPTVTTKPDAMPSDDWELLLGYGFGSIVFGNPKEGELPLPEMISEGDLDGDLYFICWNRKIIGHIQAEPCIPIVDSAGAAKAEDAELHHDSNWLPKAQQLMTNAAVTQDLSELKGVLFSLSKKAADNSSKFLSDLDAVAFGKAFTQALDFAKHGREIYLPSHLHNKVPVRLQKYLTCTKSS